MSAKRWQSQQGGVRAALATRLPLPCSRCGRSVEPDEPWDVDHLTPQAEGGTHELANLWPAHRRCNRSHGGRLGRARQAADRTSAPVFGSATSLPSAIRVPLSPRAPKPSDRVEVRAEASRLYR